MKSASATDKGEDGGFCRLLHRVVEGREPIDALFCEPVFQERLCLMISIHKSEVEDADEVAEKIRFQVRRSFRRFKPNYACGYGDFFTWVRPIIRNNFLERSKDDVQCSDERVRELQLCIRTLPKRERLATTCHVLQGLPLRITAEIMKSAGYPCRRLTLLKWVRDGLKPYFPDARGFSVEEITRKAGRSAPNRSSKQPSLVRQDRKGKVVRPSVSKPAKS